MNKKELIDAIVEDTGLSREDVLNLINAFIENISDSLKNGDSVQLIGFGTFSISNRAARIGRNPQTGAVIKIASKKVAKFKAGKKLVLIESKNPLRDGDDDLDD